MADEEAAGSPATTDGGDGAGGAGSPSASAAPEAQEDAAEKTSDDAFAGAPIRSGVAGASGDMDLSAMQGPGRQAMVAASGSVADVNKVQGPGGAGPATQRQDENAEAATDDSEDDENAAASTGQQSYEDLMHQDQVGRRAALQFGQQLSPEREQENADAERESPVPFSQQGSDDQRDGIRGSQFSTGDEGIDAAATAGLQAASGRWDQAAKTAGKEALKQDPAKLTISIFKYGSYCAILQGIGCVIILIPFFFVMMALKQGMSTVGSALGI
jgi:hypothetical protein